MRDEYVGDIGDYGKYILLNELAEIGGNALKIGINWYYNTKPEDLVFNYLEREEYKELATDLFSKLKKICAIKRSKLYGIKDIMADQVLRNIQPSLYYAEQIPYSAKTPKQRECDRDVWFKESLKKLSKAKVIFLDPDNGIETPSVKKTNSKAVKYAYIDEIRQYYDAGKSLIVYNHSNRKKLQEFAETCAGLCDKLKSHCIVIKHTKVQVRYYVCIPKTEEHRGMFIKLSKKLSEDFNLLFEIDEKLNSLINKKGKGKVIN